MQEKREPDIFFISLPITLFLVVECNFLPTSMLSQTKLCRGLLLFFRQKFAQIQADRQMAIYTGRQTARYGVIVRSIPHYTTSNPVELFELQISYVYYERVERERFC